MMYDIKRIERETAKQFLSPAKLAKKAKVSAATVLRIFQTGTGSADTIGKLVRALKLNPDDVVLGRESVELPDPQTDQAKHELMHSTRETR